MTKPASHTPGKWQLGEGFLGGFGIVTESGGLVCDIARIEDAKLIAAAPRIKALIEMIYDGFHRGVGPMATAGDAEVAEIINDTMCELLGNEWRTGDQ